MDQSIQGILELFKATFERAKDIFPELFHKDSWTDISKWEENNTIIDAFFGQLGKLLLAAKVVLVGEDGKFDTQDRDRLFDYAVDEIVKIMKIPIIPNFILKRAIKGMIMGAWQKAYSLLRKHPEELQAHIAMTEEIAKESTLYASVG